MKKETKQALELIRTIENMSKCLNQIKDEYDKKEWTEDEFNELVYEQIAHSIFWSSFYRSDKKTKLIEKMKNDLVKYMMG